MARICNHPKWNIDNHNIGTCSNPKCGERRQFPFNKDGEVVVLTLSKCNKGSQLGEVTPKKKRGRPRKRKNRSALMERHEYYLANKEAILTDHYALGHSRTAKKWEIPSSTLAGLMRKWLGAKDDAGRPGRWTGIYRLPSFPPFSNSWEPQVQVLWLQAYMKLLDSKVG